MVTDQDHGKPNDEPIEDGLSALRRLTALDDAEAGSSQRGESSKAPEATDNIPDWLELLLAKYGEQASNLVGIQPDLPTGAQTIELADSPESEEASDVASLMEKMATATDVEPSADRLATSVDWGEPARSEDEEIEDQPPIWQERLAESTSPPPVPPMEEDTPDWLSELEVDESKPEAETPTEPPEGSEYLADTEEAPDWLQEITPPPPPVTQQPVEPSSPEMAAPEGEVPDWMEQLTDIVPEQAEEALPELDEEIPEWMKELGVTASDIKPSVDEETPPIEGEAPDWLKALDVSGIAALQAEEALPTQQEAELHPGVPETGEAEGEVPDWLARLADVSTTEAEDAPAVAPWPAELPPGIEVEATAESEEEVPDWLRDLEIAQEAPAVEPSPAELPPMPPTEMTVGASLEPGEEIPDWLRELEAAEETPVEEWSSPEFVTEAPAEAEADIPDWLSDLRQETPSPLEMMAEEETPPAEPLMGEAVEEPDWLATLRTTGKPDVLELDEEVVEAEEEEAADWLAALRVSEAMVEPPPPVPELPPDPIEAEELDIPEEYHPPIEVEPTPSALAEAQEPLEEEAGALDWLAEIEAAAPPPTYPEGEEIPVEAKVPPAEEEEVPEWLLQMPPAEITTEEEIRKTEKETVETRRPPEWLVAESVTDLGDEEGEVPSPEEAPAVEEEARATEDTAPAEIPDWLLTLKPEDEKPTQRLEEEAVESEDVLADIPGLLPIVEEEEEPIAALRSRIGVPEVPDVEGAQLFKEVVSEHPEAGEMSLEAEAAPATRGGRITETLAWALIFIILITVIAVVLLAVVNRVGDLMGGAVFRDFFGSPLVIDPAPVNTFRAQVTKLPPDAVVVVSFDYSPATEAEMGPLAEVIVYDLLENQARVIAVSLRPEGPMMAQRLFERFESEYPYGERVINLGYLSGQTAGVRSLAFLSSAPLFHDWTETLNDYEAWQDVSSLNDVALIVPVSDSMLPVRWWVEQMGPGTLADRPMVAAVSAAADPSVRPYYDNIDPKAGQLLGLVSGVTDAAAYENRLGQPARAVRSLAAQSVAHLGLVVIGLGGTVMGFRMQAAKEE